MIFRKGRINIADFISRNSKQQSVDSEEQNVDLTLFSTIGLGLLYNILSTQVRTFKVVFLNRFCQKMKSGAVLKKVS